MAKKMTKKEILALLEQIRDKEFKDIKFFRKHDSSENLVKIAQTRFCLMADILNFIETGDKTYINLHIDE